MVFSLKNPINKITVCSLFLICVGAVFSSDLRAEPFSFDGNWDYRQLGGEQEENTILEQTYRLTYDKSLSSGAFFSGNVRYSKERQSNSEDSAFYNPSASLDLRNDLFTINLNGSSSQRQVDNRPGIDTTSWNVNWLSLVKNLPKLRLNFGQTAIQDDQTPKGQDSETTFYGLNVSHNYAPLRFLYDFRTNESDDFVSERKSDSRNHLGQIQYRDTFFQERLTLSASEQVTHFDSNTAVQTELGTLLFQVLPPSALGGAFAGNDDTPDLGTLNPQNALIDQDYLTGIVEFLQPAEAANLGIQVDFNPVNRIDVVLSDTLNTATSSQILWSAYTSNNNTTWTQIPLFSVSYVDDVVNGNLITVVEVELVDPATPPLEVGYIKVVAESPGAPSLLDTAFVSELEVGRLITGTGEEEKTNFTTTQYTSSLGILYRHSEHWSVGYNFSHNRKDDKQGLDRTVRAHSLSSTYRPNDDMSFSANFNESVNIIKLLQEQMSRSLSVSMYATPLDTLDYSLGYTRAESYTDDEKIQTQDTVTLYTAARIFPDLSSHLTLNLIETENFQSVYESRLWNAVLNMTARISPRLNIDTDYSYSHTTTESLSDGREIVIDIVYGGTLSYRPSDVLLMQTRAVRQESDDETTLTGSLSLRITPSLQLSESVSLRLSDEDSGAYTTRLNWGLGKHFSLESNYAYQTLDQGDIYSLLVGVRANF